MYTVCAICAVFVMLCFIFVSSYDFLIAFIISFQNMYSYRGLRSLRAEILTIFEVMTDGQTYVDHHQDSAVSVNECFIIL